MLKACSFLPAATKIIKDLGLNDNLLGVTFECDSDKPVVLKSVIDSHRLSSKEIDKIVKEAHHGNTGLNTIEVSLLEELSPDVVFTQDLCDVCQIDSETVAKSLVGLKNRPKIISLNPKSFYDVLDDIDLVAKELGVPERGNILREDISERLKKNRARLGNAPVRKVAFIEWIDPLFNAGHWIPDQIRESNGIDEISNTNLPSMGITWETLEEYNPDVLVFSPCGFGPDKALEEMKVVQEKPEWKTLQAVVNNEVYVVDSKYFTQPSSLLIDGIEILSHLFHPELVPLKPSLSASFKRVV
ncbi:MAG: ABC transporter substrate-binding protein [Flavobacteriales bacterium]|nr:ABC transporter substrate-binding protein [Flavobacteriales bacterium]